MYVLYLNVCSSDFLYITLFAHDNIKVAIVVVKHIEYRSSCILHDTFICIHDRTVHVWLFLDDKLLNL